MKVGEGNKEICKIHDKFIGKSLTFPNKQEYCDCVRIIKRRQKKEDIVNNSEVKFLFVMDGGENIVTKYYGWQTNNLETERLSKKLKNSIKLRSWYFWHNYSRK